MKTNEHFLRKLHSLSGIIPVGVFMTVHLLVNSSVLRGVESYNLAAEFMESLPYLAFLEITVIFLPLLFHGVYGVYIALQAKHNIKQYSYARNWKFYLQRITGLIAFVFILMHIWQTKMQVALYGVRPDFDMMHELFQSPLMVFIYIIGSAACIYHFANGIWTFLITWGITISEKSQKISQYAVLIIGLTLFGITMFTMFTFI